MNFVKIAACCTLLAASPAVAQTTVLKFGSGSPSASDIWKGYLEPWAKRVEAASKGALKIELHPDGSLGANGQTFDRVDAKVADIGWDIPLVYGQRFASLTVVGLPFMYEDAEKAAGAVWRLHARGMFPELTPYKVIAFTINPNVNLFFSKPLADPANLAGNKVAVGSKVRGQMVSAMKGVPVSVVVPEYYQALSRGVVGGVMTNVQVLQAWKLGEVVHHYVDGPFGGGVSVLFMDKKKYEELPPAARQAIDQNSGEAESKIAAKAAIESETTIMKDLLKISTNKNVKLEGPAREAWRVALEPLATEWETSTKNGKELKAAFAEELAR